jgi:hypothetical protein
MSKYAKLLGIGVVVSGLGLSEALFAGDVWKGSWKFEIDRQDQPALSYYDTSGRRIFGIACGVHFEMNAVYPGAAPKEVTPGSITIANGKTQMDFAGNVFHNPEVEMPTDLPFFNQADLGHPELDEDKWRALENRVLDLLGSGHLLTISAEGKSYVLPAVKVPRWRARFQKIC